MEGNAQKQLIAKLQYKNFEPGEFTDQQNRTYEQTIALIEAFPWEQQREHVHIGLTNPSVTVEGEYHHFIKLTVYYQGSFVLYYLNADNHLYLKSFSDYHLAYPYLQSFFEDGLLDTADMKLQQHWMQGKLIHFKDRDFRYIISRPKIIVFISLISLYLVFISLMMVAALINGLIIHKAFFIMGLFFVFIFSLVTATMAQLINHFRAVIGKELILSKGKDIFYFGKKGQPEKWDKKNIVSMTYFSARAQRSSRYGCFVRIDLKSAEPAIAKTSSIYIPSILISEIYLLAKFPTITPTHISKFFPFIPLSASTPS